MIPSLDNLRLDEARRFLNALGPGEEFTFQTFSEHKPSSKEEATRMRKFARVTHGRLDQHTDTLSQLNVGDDPAGVFVTVNRTDGKGRKAENVTGIRAVFVDLDGAPIEPVTSAPLAPSIVVESSPGRFHAYWLTREVSLEDFSGFQRLLIERFDGDRAIHDLPRVLRVPGFLHRKAEPFHSRLVTCKPDRVYTRAQLVDAFGDPVTATALSKERSDVKPPTMPDDLQAATAKRLAAEHAEKVIHRPALGRHAQALQLGYDCRREQLGEHAAKLAAREYHALIPDQDSDGQHRPRMIEEVERAVMNAYAEGKTVNREKRLSDYIIVGREIVDLKIEPRAAIVEPFIMEKSLSMIYARRGVGKTWLALQLALSVARGEKFFEWQVTGPRPVLYIDGEMPLSDLRERVMMLASGEVPGNLMLLPSERLFLEDRPLNINNQDDQARILAALEDLENREQRPGVLIFDNLSSLSSGVDENSNSELDKLLAWLLQLRHRGYAVAVVHHAGKSGQQRGASRREDLLDTSIKLEEIPAHERPGAVGASFSIGFDKVRGKRPKPDTLTVELIASDRGGLTWAIGQPTSMSAEMRALVKICEEEPSSQSVLASKLGVSEARVSEYARRLREKNFLERGRGLMLTSTGRARAQQLGCGTGPF